MQEATKRETDGAGDHHIKWSRPVLRKQAAHFISYGGFRQGETLQ